MSEQRAGVKAFFDVVALGGRPSQADYQEMAWGDDVTRVAARWVDAIHRVRSPEPGSVYGTEAQATAASAVDAIVSMLPVGWQPPRYDPDELAEQSYRRF